MVEDGDPPPGRAVRDARRKRLRAIGFTDAQIDDLYKGEGEAS